VRAGIHVSQLFRWRKELCQIEEPRTETVSTLVPVIVSEVAPAAQPAATETPAPSHPRRKRSDVTIELGRGRRVRVDSDIDTEALGRILDCVLGRR
jgi:transposase